MSEDEDTTVGSLEDLEQQEPEDYNIRAVPVNVEGPVQVQFLPARKAVYRNISITTTAQQLLSDDPRRARAIIVAVDGDIYLGASSQEITQGIGFRLPDPQSIDILHSRAVWVGAVAGTVQISLLVENWAD